MGHLYILKDTGYQEYRDLLAENIPIKDMAYTIQKRREEEENSKDDKLSKKAIIAILSAIISLILIGTFAFCYLISELDLFSPSQPITVEGVISK